MKNQNKIKKDVRHVGFLLLLKTVEVKKKKDGSKVTFHPFRSVGLFPHRDAAIEHAKHRHPGATYRVQGARADFTQHYIPSTRTEKNNAA